MAGTVSLWLTVCYVYLAVNGEGFATSDVEPASGDLQFSLSETYLRGGNSTGSFEHLILAAHLGHPAAQHRVAVAYGTGLYYGRLPLDPGRAVVLDYFSALAGHSEAHMSMGYRYLKGLGLPQSCEKAAVHYEFAANHAAEQITSRGYVLRSVQSKLTNHIPWLSDDVNEKELVEYYDRMAQEGDLRAMHTLGKLYMQGSLHIDQDMQRAAAYFRRGADAGHVPSAGQIGLMYARGIGVPVDGQRALQYLQKASRSGDTSAILGLGYCYHMGLGVERNISTAIELFQSVGNKHEEAGFFTAELLLGVENAQLVHGDGSSGVKELDGKRKDAHFLNVAQQFYLTSASRGHILSLHRLGHIGLQTKSAHACQVAQNFKMVAEAGDWGHKSTLAHRLFNEGDMSGALQLFAELAYEGYESAQMNAAFILTKMFCPARLNVSQESAELLSEKTALRSPQFLLLSHPDEKARATSAGYGTFYLPSQWANREMSEEVSGSRDPTMHTGHHGAYESVLGRDAVECEQSMCLNFDARAIALYSHSAMQGSGASFLKVGDFHYYGLAGLVPDKAEAARYYQMAADLKNTHALFNLGIMHQTGDGVLKDFHLAKRFYDEAAVYDTFAKTPSVVAVLLLQLHRLLCDTLGDESSAAFLAELKVFVVDANEFIGLGALVFQMRSRLLQGWLQLNKSVLLSSGATLDMGSYSFSNTTLGSVTAKISDYLYYLDVAVKRSRAFTAFLSYQRQLVSVASLADSEKVMSTCLFLFTTALFVLVYRYRALRRRRQ